MSTTTATNGGGLKQKLTTIEVRILQILCINKAIIIGISSQFKKRVRILKSQNEKP